MSERLSVERRYHVRAKQRGQKALRRGEPKPEPPRGRVPRVAKLMALAIRFDQLIRDGLVRDQAELASLGHVTRARVSQILAFLQLRRRFRRRFCSWSLGRGGRGSEHSIAERSEA